jgi:hypothetical protein
LAKDQQNEHEYTISQIDSDITMLQKEIQRIRMQEYEQKLL